MSDEEHTRRAPFPVLPAGLAISGFHRRYLGWDSGSHLSALAPSGPSGGRDS